MIVKWCWTKRQRNNPRTPQQWSAKHTRTNLPHPLSRTQIQASFSMPSGYSETKHNNYGPKKYRTQKIQISKKAFSKIATQLLIFGVSTKKTKNNQQQKSSQFDHKPERKMLSRFTRQTGKLPLNMGQDQQTHNEQLKLKQISILQCRTLLTPTVYSDTQLSLTCFHFHFFPSRTD